MSYNNGMSYNNEITEENEEDAEQVSITVLNRQTNGPHPDCDLEIDAVATPTEEEESDFELPPTHALELGIFNFVDSRYSPFYNNMYNFIQPGIISYTEYEDEENKIEEIDLDDLVMPAPCETCYHFHCSC